MCLLFAATPATFLVCDTLFHGPFLAHANAVPLAAPASACVCAAASAHPCDVCSPKKVTLLLIFCTYCNIYTIQLQKLWLGGSAERVLCVYTQAFFCIKLRIS